MTRRSPVLVGLLSILSAAASSACCWLPLVLPVLGFSLGGAVVFFERYRLPFLILAGGLLSLGFYLNYGVRETCNPDGTCVNPRWRRFHRAMLWISTFLVVAFAGFPLCRDTLAEALHGLRGGGPAEASLDERLAGRWTATVPDENDSIDVAVDIGRPQSRWVGEFDLPGYGVDNYPVAVSGRGREVELDFTALEATFQGALTEDGRTLRGTVLHEDRKIPVSLNRAGATEFSPTLLELEAAAVDPSAVQVLSRDGRELRERFNQASDRTRLLLLLSPS